MERQRVMVAESINMVYRISIEGSIGASKSTLLEGLQAKYPSIPVMMEPVHEWGEWLELFYKDTKRWSFGFQMKVLASFLRPVSTDAPVVLYERSPLSNKEVFSQLLFAQGLMSHTELDLYKAIYDQVSWKPDAIIYVKCTPEECLARVNHRNRPAEQRVTLEYLKKVDFHYTHMLKYFKGPVLYVDGQHPDGPGGVLHHVSLGMGQLFPR